MGTYTPKNIYTSLSFAHCGSFTNKQFYLIPNSCIHLHFSPLVDRCLIGHHTTSIYIIWNYLIKNL